MAAIGGARRTKIHLRSYFFGIGTVQGAMHGGRPKHDDDAHIQRQMLQVRRGTTFDILIRCTFLHNFGLCLCSANLHERQWSVLNPVEQTWRLMPIDFGDPF